MQDYWIPKKWAGYKLFELKYGNTELLGNKKNKQVKSGLAVFASAFCTKLAYIKQTWYN